MGKVKGCTADRHNNQQQFGLTLFDSYFRQTRDQNKKWSQKPLKNGATPKSHMSREINSFYKMIKALILTVCMSVAVCYGQVDSKINKANSNPQINTKNPTSSLNFEGTYFMTTQANENDKDHNECTLTLTKVSNFIYKWVYEEKLQMGDWKQTQTFSGEGKLNGNLLNLFVKSADVSHPVISLQKGKPNVPSIIIKKENANYMAKFNLSNRMTCLCNSTEDFFQIKPKEIQNKALLNTQTIIEEIKTSKGSFPLIRCQDQNLTDEINKYICQKVFNKSYNRDAIKSVIEIENWDDTYSNYTEVSYKLKSNTNTNLQIQVVTCFMGAAEHCFEYNFSFNPTTRSKNVQIVQ